MIDNKLINLDKLEKQVQEQSAQRATDELNRMIQLHQDQLKVIDNRIKGYLKYSSRPDSQQSYTGTTNSLAAHRVIHASAVAYLNTLMDELTTA